MRTLHTTPRLLVPVLAGMLAPAWCCAQPFAPFTEEAVARGITHNVGITNFSLFGAGVGFADLDGDGDADLVALGRTDGRVGIWENDGTGHFTPRRVGSGLAFNSQYNGLSFADYDHDGDVDMYISCLGQPAMLYRNDGGFTFTDVAPEAGVNSAGAGQGITWADYDGDGDLDMYLANRTAPILGLPQNNRLYRNNGDGTFTDVAAALGVDDPGVLSFQGGFFDIDRDGDPDLYVAEDKGLPACKWHNRLWRNDQGAFTDISAPSGAGICMDGMCVTVGDYDADGRLDLYVTNTQTGANKLFRNRGEGVFEDVAPLRGATVPALCWGSQFLDFDNDGRLDLYVLAQQAPNRLLRQGEGGNFANLAPALGLDVSGYSFCTAFADIDADGDLDMVMLGFDQPLRLYINHEGEKRHWIGLRVVSADGPRDAIGAVVDVTAGGRTQTAEVLATNGFKSQNQAALHFGLGEATAASEVVVTWPHGGGTRTLRNHAADRSWTVYPDSKLGDSNQDGRLTSQDFFDFLSCFFGATSAGYAPGCEMMDINGDGVATSTDFFEFLARFFDQ